VYSRKKFLTSVFILKSGISDDINSLRRFVAEVANVDGPEEEHVVDSWPVRGYLRDLRRRQYVCLHLHVM
jgi:hypothetical protein